MVNNTQKLVVKDEQGRKIRTDHFTQDGVLDYVNTYFYEGNSKLPLEGSQTYYDSEGHALRVINNQLSEDKDHFIMTRDSWYNKDGSLISVSDYNLAGQKIKEKSFYKDENGFTCYHRKHFDPKTGKETLNQDILRLSVGDVVITPEIQKIMNKYNHHYGVEKETPKTHSKVQLPKAAILKAATKGY